MAYPEYVTDGFHIYLWNDEYDSLFAQGKLKACDAPPPVAAPKLTKEEERKVEEMRKKALEDANLAIKMYGSQPTQTAAPAPAPKAKSMEEMFGSPPKE